MRLRLSSGAATVLAGALFVGVGVTGQAQGQVPVSESPPLACATANFAVTATVVPSTCGGVPCTAYNYSINANVNVDHAVFAVSATQAVNSTAPGAANISALGVGDNVTGFLAQAQHEYAVRFNPQGAKTFLASIAIAGASKPRVGTMLIRSGNKLYDSCLIASPGIAAGDVFQPVFQFQQVVLAGGKCSATLVFDALGDVSDIVNAQPIPPYTGSCVVGSPSGDLFVNGAPLKNNSGPHGITFGTGTSTCYGPPRPSIPKCVCTAEPCP